MQPIDFQQVNASDGIGNLPRPPKTVGRIRSSESAHFIAVWGKDFNHEADDRQQTRMDTNWKSEGRIREIWGIRS